MFNSTSQSRRQDLRLKQWDAVYRAAGERFNVDPALIKALTLQSGLFNAAGFAAVKPIEVR